MQALNADFVRALSKQKNEPLWMTEFRLQALALFDAKPLPTWGADLSALNQDALNYYVSPRTHQAQSWNDVPTQIKDTFDALGIPQAEQKMLAGVGAQFESEVIYKSLKKEWSDQGVIFCSMDDGLRLYPDLVRTYFATVVSSADNKFAALNSAVWSGGSFVYVPRGVHITMPLQAYFRIEQKSMGQFERTLIIADEGSSVHYVEGCSAPLYTSHSLHSAVVEIIAHKRASVRYTTIQNWSTNVFNLVTKRALAYQDAAVVWVDGNFGSGTTMKYPCVVLKEEGARAEVISLAVADAQQHQDTGAKMIHCAPRTRSTIISKSISKQGGRSSYRGLVKIIKGAHQAQAHVQCDALLLDAQSRSDTYPTMYNAEKSAHIGHEASITALNDQQLFYLMSRGLSRQMALSLLVSGFIDPFVNLLPLEYAVEINRLIEHDMEGSIG